MKRIGEVKTITGSIAIVQGEDQTRPKIGTKVIDEKLENVGRIVDVIGPVSRPYMVIKIKEGAKSILKKRVYSRRRHIQKSRENENRTQENNCGGSDTSFCIDSSNGGNITYQSIFRRRLSVS